MKRIDLSHELKDRSMIESEAGGKIALHTAGEPAPDQAPSFMFPFLLCFSLQSAVLYQRSI